MESAVIVKNLEITPGIFMLEFKRAFGFEPGQVVKISTHSDIAPRMYSIASGNEEENIRIIYDIKPTGLLTNMLKTMRIGQEILVSAPFGQFQCKEPEAWWIATGTGIAPFYAMMKSGQVVSRKLLHGVRNQSGFLFQEEFLEAFGENYIRCCSGGDGQGLYPGRVTDYLQRQGNFSPAQKFYLCGSAEMVVDVRDLLILKGVGFGNIFSEIYF